MKIQKKENGTLIVPKLIETEDMIIDRMVEVPPESPDYQLYLSKYEREQKILKDLE